MYNLIAVLHELDAVGDATGVTLQRLKLHPDLPSGSIADLLDELYEDGIIQEVTFVPRQDSKCRSRCDTARMQRIRAPRYRLRSRTYERE